jgi:hypothetical protein
VNSVALLLDHTWCSHPALNTRKTTTKCMSNSTQSPIFFQVQYSISITNTIRKPKCTNILIARWKRIWCADGCTDRFTTQDGTHSDNYARIDKAPWSFIWMGSCSTQLIY